MRSLKPWTEVSCDQCGSNFMATRTVSCTVSDDEELLCPECSEYNRGYKGSMLEIKRLQAEIKQLKGDVMNPEAVLCYVRKRTAWFTTASPEDITGDDWNDRPYECNAGDPYFWDPVFDVPRYDLFKVYFDGDFRQPCEGHFNSPWSVDDINAGAISWLRNTESSEMIVIPAWTTYSEFCRLIEYAGGTVYEPRKIK